VVRIATRYENYLILLFSTTCSLFEIAVLASKSVTPKIYNSSIISDGSSLSQSIINGSIPAYVYYYFLNQTYDYSWFQDPDNVQCVASTRYQWGFSGGIYFLFSVLSTGWVIGTYGVWVHMNRKSELCRKGRSLGKYRAVVDMGEAIRAALGSDICAYSDRELENKLMQRPGIKYSVLYETGNSLAHIGLSSVDNREKMVLNFGELYGGLREKIS
jgi:hypothetical protein